MKLVRKKRLEWLMKTARERILVLDGAWGVMIQNYRLSEKDFRGPRFADSPRDLKGNNDLLVLTQPDVIREIGRAYLHAGADIIESNSFNDQTFLDATGLPHSDRLVTTERVRKIGNQLEDVVTIHDPELYTKDWQARFVYAQRDDVRLQDYACGDKHRDISSVKGVNEARGAHAQER